MSETTAAGEPPIFTRVLAETMLTLAAWGDVSHLENPALDEVDRRVP